MPLFTTPEPHQYIERISREVCNERLHGDRLVDFLYSDVRENADILFRALTGPRFSSLLAFLNYDLTLGTRNAGANRLIQKLKVDLGECLDPSRLTSPRKVFERQIRYWLYRPIPKNPRSVVSPSDAKMLAGSLKDTSSSGLFIKRKFFDVDELLGSDQPEWRDVFREGDFAVFRLTPDKYHYNHVPVDGCVEAFYEVRGSFHSCNPTVAARIEAPCSKNKRVVTILNTEISGGTRIGLVAMIEIVALMIGDIAPAYSEEGYWDPRPLNRGMWLRKGCPKSLFRPGSSTVVLLFEPGRIRFDPDILENLFRQGVRTRFAQGLGRPLVETEVAVRSQIGLAVPRTHDLERRRAG